MSVCRLSLAAILLPLIACADTPVTQGPPNAGFAPAFDAQTRAPALPETAVSVDVFASGLEHLWGIAPLPGGDWIVTERPGRMRIVSAAGEIGSPLDGVPAVAAERQGGLLDVAVAPDGTIFWTYAKRVDGGFATAAARGQLSEDRTALVDVVEIFVQEPASPTPMHYGARIIPDGPYVWITTGEHSSGAEQVLAQDIETTFGKVIRLFADGSVPPDNPFVGRDGIDSIWSLGHRNMQGAALHPLTGLLWSNEHGPRGGDEINQPVAGANYGWPVISYGINYNGSDVGQGIAVAAGMEQPVYYWDPVIAPGGMAFYEGDLFDWENDLLIGSLNPGALVRLRFGADGLVSGEERLITDVGRIRDVEVAADGSVLVLVDSADGAILRLTPGG